MDLVPQDGDTLRSALLSSPLHLTLLFLGQKVPAHSVPTPDLKCDFQLLGLEFILLRNRLPAPPRNPQFVQQQEPAETHILVLT